MKQKRDIRNLRKRDLPVYWTDQISLVLLWSSLYPSHRTQTTHTTVWWELSHFTAGIWTNSALGTQVGNVYMNIPSFSLHICQHGNADALSRLPLPEQLSEEVLTPAELVLRTEYLENSPVTVTSDQKLDTEESTVGESSSLHSGKMA